MSTLPNLKPEMSQSASFYWLKQLALRRRFCDGRPKPPFAKVFEFLDSALVFLVAFFPWGVFFPLGVGADFVFAGAHRTADFAVIVDFCVHAVFASASGYNYQRGHNHWISHPMSIERNVVALCGWRHLTKISIDCSDPGRIALTALRLLCRTAAVTNQGI